MMLFLLENILFLVEVDTPNVLFLNEHYMVSFFLLYSSSIQMIFYFKFFKPYT